MVLVKYPRSFQQHIQVIRAVKLNTILSIVVLSVFVFFLYANKQNTFLVGSEFPIYVLLLSVLCSLFINLYVKNEILDILNVLFVIFYVCRIPFILGGFVESDVIDRSVPLQDIYYYITVLIFQYLSLVASILLLQPKIDRSKIQYLPSSLFRRIAAYAFVLMFVNYVESHTAYSIFFGLPLNVSAIFFSIFSMSNILLLIVVLFFMTNKNKILNRAIVILCMLLFLYWSVSIGNKSAIFYILLCLLLAITIFRKPILLYVREIVLVCLLAGFSVSIYVLGKIYRYLDLKGQALASDNIISVFNVQYLQKTTLIELINSISYRIGYFDFFIQKISLPAYEEYVNLSYYFKAFVDKVTPGFDIYNAAFMSRMIYSVYHGPSEKTTNSELITIFAESYLIFGVYSLVFFMVVIYLMKKILTVASELEIFKFSYILICVYILRIFYLWFTGIGLDMVLMRAVYNALFFIPVVFLINGYYKHGSFEQGQSF